MTRACRISFLSFCSDNLNSKIGDLKWSGLLTIVIAFVELAGVVEAQQPTKIPRIKAHVGSEYFFLWPHRNRSPA